MHPQLAAIADDFRSAERRLQALAGRVPLVEWQTRPGATRWSIAECVAHLNLTSRAYLPILRDALDRARQLPPFTGRYRRDLAGWLLWKVMPPPVRFKTRTADSFVPAPNEPAERLIAEFERLQAEQLRCLAAADGLSLNAVRIASPFNGKITYNLYACFSILPRHQHRHLWQAEQVAQTR